MLEREGGMRDAIAIVAPSIDVQQLAREIAKAHVELQDTDRKLEASEQKTEGLRQQQGRQRVEIGRLLVEAKSGVKHGGWLPYLEKLGIEARNAQRWMELSGYVESSKYDTSQNVSYLNETPTLADAGIDKRPRKSDSIGSEKTEPFHVLVASGRLRTSVTKIVESWPRESRRSIPGLLRDLADEIEGDL